MNRTMILMMTALLVGLAQVPTAQSQALLERVTSQLVDGDLDCESLIEGVGFSARKVCEGPAPIEPDLETCPPGEVGVAGEKAFCTPIPGLDDAGTCPRGEVGIQMGGKDTCKPKPGLETGDCPTGTLGVVVGGIEVCSDRTIPDPELCPAGQVPVNHDCYEVRRFGPCDAVEDACSTPDPDVGREPSCTRTEDDSGMGGTEVECKYACATGDELGIHVKAMDDSWGTARAYGNTECGGAYARCDKEIKKNECIGASEGPAKHGDSSATCEGNSDEVWSSPVEVTCFAAGPSALCAALKELCTSMTLRVDLGTACGLDGLPDNLAAQIGHLLELVPEGPTTSFVAFSFDQGQGAFIRLDASPYGLLCEAASL